MAPHHATARAPRKGLREAAGRATLGRMFRFLHSSDLHLGKPFGALPEDIRHRLREARHGVLARLAAAARTQGATHILLAGDTFDAATPAPATRRHALRAMAQADDLTWVMLPGNHDSLAASELWRAVAAEAPGNLVPVLEAQPLALVPGVALLPAPLPVRRPGRDLTDWFDGAGAGAGGEGLRIGLAHGPVAEFGEGSGATIAPDRAARAGLDWLALGDWHGELRIGARTAYSGTPERDAFKHEGPGTALAVALAPGAPPQVTRLQTGAFDWRAPVLDLLPGIDPAALLGTVLPPPEARRDTLLSLTLRGRIDPAGRAALAAAVAAVAPDFGWLGTEAGALASVIGTADLDLIDRAGALRAAAEALQTRAADPALPEAERRIAAAALDRLIAFALEVEG